VEVDGGQALEVLLEEALRVVLSDLLARHCLEGPEDYGERARDVRWTGRRSRTVVGARCSWCTYGSTRLEYIKEDLCWFFSRQSLCWMGSKKVGNASRSYKMSLHKRKNAKHNVTKLLAFSFK
jgi:hypothetical protein